MIHSISKNYRYKVIHLFSCDMAHKDKCLPTIPPDSTCLLCLPFKFPLIYVYIYILLNCRTWDGRPPFEQLKEILVGWFIGGMKNYARLVRMITVHSGDSYQPSTVHGCKKGGSKPVAHLNHCHLGYINAT